MNNFHKIINECLRYEDELEWVEYKENMFVIDAFGTGFDRTFTLCSQNNVEYKYSSDDFGFTFTFLRNEEFLNDKINDKINEIDKKIMAEMNDNKYVTIPALAIKIGKSEPTIHRRIDALVSKGIVKRVGSRKTGYWEIK